MTHFSTLDNNQIRAACFEYAHSQKQLIGQYIGDQDDVFELFLPRFSGNDQLEYHAIFLNIRLRVISSNLVHTATDESPVFSIRRTIALALESKAAAMILVHNHPGPNIKPSLDEIRATLKLKTVAKLLGIYLADHLIVSSAEDYRYFSFFSDDEGLTGFNEIL